MSLPRNPLIGVALASDEHGRSDAEVPGEAVNADEREPVEGTVWYVRAVPVYLSPRWRFEISADGASGSVLVTSSSGTYARPEAAKQAGVAYAGAMARKLRKDLGRSPSR